jgi:hypothetical protein
VPLADQQQPEGLDEGRLAHAGHARDAQAKRLAGARQQRGEQLVGLRAVVGARRFEQRDGLGDGAALPHSLGARERLFERLHRVQHVASDATRQR